MVISFGHVSSIVLLIAFFYCSVREFITQFWFPAIKIVEQRSNIFIDNQSIQMILLKKSLGDTIGEKIQ